MIEDLSTLHLCIEIDRSCLELDSKMLDKLAGIPDLYSPQILKNIFSAS